jgi:hypothetical protein
MLLTFNGLHGVISQKVELYSHKMDHEDYVGGRVFQKYKFRVRLVFDR